MFIAALKNIFDIDNVGNRWGVRILYIITVVLNAAIHFNPWADTDFTPLQSWAMEVYNLTEYDADQYNALMNAIPISTGNIIYIASMCAGYLLLLASAYIYAAVYVREFRKEKVSSVKDDDPEVLNYAIEHIPDKPIKVSELFLRLVLIMLFSTLISMPFILITFYFMFIAIIGLPFVFTAPVAYLSGDAGFFSSLPYAVRLSRKYYFINMRSIGIILFAILIVDFTVPLIANISLTAFYILDAAITTWIWLAFARLAGMAYCTMKDFPIKGGKRPFAI
ncbi:MAG: hypothetical protein IKT10_05510 [Clostridiales bacterium]|nr:hypothetical protein [Clostridiales bacterium]